MKMRIGTVVMHIICWSYWGSFQFFEVPKGHMCNFFSGSQGGIVQYTCALVGWVWTFIIAGSTLIMHMCIQLMHI